MKLAIGCPIRDRAWIIPHWFEHIKIAAAAAAAERGEAIHVVFVFVGDPRTDAETFKVINHECLSYSWPRLVVELDEPAGEYKRVWNAERFGHMVHLRNTLLAHVRRLEPDFFWSLDSDILVADRALSSALEATDQFDAIGTKLFMTSGNSRACPSYGMLPAQASALRRSDGDGLFPVDVIMASKIMAPKAYAVDYQVHRQGEDIGWSIAARKAGCRLGWDGRVTSKHVMTPAELSRIDDRVGF